MRRPDAPEIIYIRVPDWPDAWAGWRFRGNVLISPDGDRFTPERLAGLGWRQAQEARRAREKRFAGVSDGLRSKIVQLTRDKGT